MATQTSAQQVRLKQWQNRSETVRTTHRVWMSRPGAPRTTLQKRTIITVCAEYAKYIWTSSKIRHLTLSNFLLWINVDFA